MEFNNENVKKIKEIIVFTVVLIAAMINYRSIIYLMKWLFCLVWPFALGGIFAFVINIPMNVIEKVLFSGMVFTKGKLKGVKRPCSILITIILGVLAVLSVMLLVIPQLTSTFVVLQGSIPAFADSLNDSLQKIFKHYPDIVKIIDKINIDWNSILTKITEFLSSGAGSVFTNTLSAALGILNGLTMVLIAFIFSIYILLEKEKLKKQAEKVIVALLRQDISGRLFEVLKLTEKTFSSFFTGQCLEAVILGTMFFVTLTLFRLPYAMLIGVVIAFTALIPMVGAFIGLALGTFLMLMSNPATAITFVIIFFVLQQIEGNLIYPHVVGSSVGLPSIWVLVAVTVGGSAFGVAGMIVFIPLCSVLYNLFRSFIDKKYKKKVVQKSEKE